MRALKVLRVELQSMGGGILHLCAHHLAGSPIATRGGSCPRQPGLKAQTCGWPPTTYVSWPSSSGCPILLFPPASQALAQDERLREHLGTEGWEGAENRAGPRQQSWPKATVISRQSWPPRGIGVPGPLPKRQEPGQMPLSPKPTWGWGSGHRLTG